MAQINDALWVCNISIKFKYKGVLMKMVLQRIIIFSFNVFKT